MMNFARLLRMIAGVGSAGAVSLCCFVVPREELVDQPRLLNLRPEVVRPWLVGGDSSELLARRRVLTTFDTFIYRPYIVGTNGEEDLTKWHSVVVLCDYFDLRCTTSDQSKTNDLLLDFRTLPTCQQTIPATYDEWRSLIKMPPVLPCRTALSDTAIPELVVPVATDGRVAPKLSVLWLGAPLEGPDLEHCADRFFQHHPNIDEGCLIALRREFFGSLPSQWEDLHLIFSTFPKLSAQELRDTYRPSVEQWKVSHSSSLDVSNVNIHKLLQVHEGDSLIVLPQNHDQPFFLRFGYYLSHVAPIQLYSTIGRVEPITLIDPNTGQATDVVPQWHAIRQSGDPVLQNGNRSYLYIVDNDIWQTFEVEVLPKSEVQSEPNVYTIQKSEMRIIETRHPLEPEDSNRSAL